MAAKNARMERRKGEWEKGIKEWRKRKKWFRSIQSGRGKRNRRITYTQWKTEGVHMCNELSGFQLRTPAFFSTADKKGCAFMPLHANFCQPCDLPHLIGNASFPSFCLFYYTQNSNNYYITTLNILKAVQVKWTNSLRPTNYSNRHPQRI